MLVRMSAAPHPTTAEAFLGWAESQPTRHEFDGIRPVAMTGGDLGHSRLIRNISRALANRLAGRPCDPLGPDAAIATAGDTIRHPDAVVTCTPFSDRDRLVPDPVVVFEVVSPSSVRTDRVTKLHECQAVPGIRRHIIVEPGAVAVTVLSRDHADEAFHVTGLADTDILDLPETGIEIPVADLYGGLAPAPRQP